MTTAKAELLASSVPAECQDGRLIELFEQVKKEVNAEVQDVETQEGRAAIRENAQKVSKSKKAIDDRLRDYLRELKTLPRVVEQSARDSIERFDNLRAELLAKMAAEFEPQKAALDSLDQIETSCKDPTLPIPVAHLEKTLQEVELIDIEMFWEEGRPKARKRIKETKATLAAAIEAEKARAAHAAEIEKLKAEKQAADLEALKARIAADEKIKAQQSIERAKIDAQEAIAAAARAQAQELQKAQQAAEMAARIEREKIEAQQAAEVAAAEKRAADHENRIARNREALADFVAQGLSEEDAKAVITMIIKKQIRNIVINY